MDGEADAVCRRRRRDRDARRERLAPPARRIAETVDIVMAVALGMGDADEGAEREILLHGKARPGRSGPRR